VSAARRRGRQAAARPRSWSVGGSPTREASCRPATKLECRRLADTGGKLPPGHEAGVSAARRHGRQAAARPRSWSVGGSPTRAAGCRTDNGQAFAMRRNQ